jgi:membrane protein implicated in regulation of membrane protease activity
MKRWSFRVIRRYTLFQIPELLLLTLALYGLHHWFSVPLWMVGMILGIWIAKDIILFFFIWRAYEIPKYGRDPRLEGAAGVTIEILDPLGYVEINGELWKAQSKNKQPIPARQKVAVVDHKGLLLVVHKYKENSKRENRNSKQIRK